MSADKAAAGYPDEEGGDKKKGMVKVKTVIPVKMIIGTTPGTSATREANIVRLFATTLHDPSAVEANS